jgi:heptosyltransferase-2
MNWKEKAFEGALHVAGRVTTRSVKAPLSPANVHSIFILRNNDMGDLLVTTPLFEALRRTYPEARIVVGIGAWNQDILKNNPHITEARVVSAPWHNHHVKQFSLREALKYIFASDEVKQLAREGYDVGIDVFGSNLGMALLIRAGIPYRIGVKGFRGGHSAAQWCVLYDRTEHVSRANLHIAEHLGAETLPPPRPQLFLSDAETRDAKQLWETLEADSAAPPGGLRVLVGPGAGHPGSWPVERFAELTRRISEDFGATVLVAGGKGDVEKADAVVAACRGTAFSRAGMLSLRESLAAISQADLVLCNSTMLMHAAAAFSRKTLALLGPNYKSAAEEAALWGYPGTCIILGRGDVQGKMATVDEAYAAAVGLLGNAAAAASESGSPSRTPPPPVASVLP